METSKDKAKELLKNLRKVSTFETDEAQELVNILAEALNVIGSRTLDSSRLSLPFPHSYSPPHYYTELDFKNYFQNTRSGQEYEDGYPSWIDAGWQTSSEWKDC